VGRQAVKRGRETERSRLPRRSTERRHSCSPSVIRPRYALISVSRFDSLLFRADYQVLSCLIASEHLLLGSLCSALLNSTNLLPVPAVVLNTYDDARPPFESRVDRYFVFA